MSIARTNEVELLEALSEAENASQCLLAAYDALNNTIDNVLKSIFYKNDYSVKFVVAPLLDNDGPLGDIMIRAKLLLGLGVIEKTMHDDINIFVTLRDWVKIQDGQVDFTEQNIIYELNKVTAIAQIMPIEFEPEIFQTLNGTILDMFLERHHQKVKSTIALAITEMINLLCRENVLTS